MSDILPIGPALNGPVHRASLNGHPTGLREFIETPPSEQPADRVELSERARYLDRLHELPPTRREKVDRLRDAIAAGQYPSDDEVQLALDRLIDDLVD